MNVVWLILDVPWVGLQFVIVVFPDHTHLLFLTCNFLRAEYYIQQGDINNVIRLVDKALHRLA